MKKLLAGVLAGATLAGQAQAACWTPRQVAAAQIRDLDAMLMVAALRCRSSNPEVVARYNGFVQADRAALQQVNTTLKGHFAAQVGAKASLDAFDGYVTKVANKYGAGAERLTCSDMGSIIDAAAAEAPTFAGLAAVAERAQVQPLLDDARCLIETAAK